MLLRPVDQVLTIAIVVFRILATAIFAFAELFYFAPSLLLTSESYLKSFSPDQLNTLTLLSLNLYGVGGAMSLAFYGVASIGIGYLIFRSQYLPRWLGIVYVIGGACFVLRTFTFVLFPQFPGTIFQLPQVLAILLLAIWLLAIGVDVPRWEAAAPRSGLAPLS